MRRLTLSRKARADITEIWRSIVDADEKAAKALLLRISRKLQTALTFPNMGAPRPDIGTGTRMLVEGKYLILYEMQDDDLFVLRIVHGARDLPSL